ncbi:uncharacterized protein CDAR_123201 [Caerostris darwini]|uniref:Uncharacterized protein n=1 Tax=Caerostris darwini TaxID=1538125 RepID=A0AAV4QFC0_9ARAC|nr:uncharacterized protein CDAR_123201 [Caerostris darwini]
MMWEALVNKNMGDCILWLATPCPCPYSVAYNDIKRKINKAIKNYNVTQATGKSWSVLLSNPIPGNLLRQVTTANFRLLTSHDYLQGHLYRIGISPSTDCPLCSEGNFMCFNHPLSCSALRDKHFIVDIFLNRADLYWAARRKILVFTLFMGVRGKKRFMKWF